MAFPVNPLDGQKTTQNGIVYSYSTSTNSWRRDFNNVIDRLTLAGQYGSTSTEEGTLVVYGGVGIGENINVAGDTVIDGNLTVGATVNLSPPGSDVYIEPSINGTVIIYPAAYGRIDNMVIGGTQPKIGYFTDLVAKDSTQSYGTDTGALTVAGGAGIARDLFVGGTIYQNGIPVSSGKWITTSSNYTANDHDSIIVDTSLNPVTITLPSSPEVGNTITFIDYAKTFGTNNLIFSRNGSLIMGLDEDLIVDMDNAANKLIYVGPSQGWKIGVVF